MKVVDAGVIAELLAGRLDPDQLGDEELAALHLIDSEVTHVLRGLVHRGVLSNKQGDLALDEASNASRSSVRVPTAHADPVPRRWATSAHVGTAA